MAVIKATEIRKGCVLKVDNDLYVVQQMDHVTPGNYQAVVKLKLKSIARKVVVPKRYNSSDTVERVDLDTRWVQYIYDQDDEVVFMDNNTFEQFNIRKEDIEEELQYICHDDNVQVTFHDGIPVSVELPTSVVLEVIEAEPSAKGNSATNITKNITLKTGLVVKAPPHINVGEKVKIDTRTGAFIERAK
jgi:elongation factor P